MARSNSRVAKSRADYQKDSGILRRDTPADISDENRTENESARTYTTVLGGIATTIARAGYILRGGNVFGKVANGVAVGVAATTASGLVSRGLIDNVTTVDIQTAIELYLTQPPIAQYSADWENKELGAFGGFLANGGSADISRKGILSGARGLSELAVRGLIGAAATIPSELGISGDLAAGIDVTTRKTQNPYKEQLFKSMGFRKFAFAYKFAPRNKTELESVMQIIQQLKYHMHPEKDPSGLFLEYPSEFEIEYHYKGAENQFMSKISTCALTDMKVTYGGQDAFTSFRDTEGAPSEIQMDLAFQELETLTNDRIGLNYRDSL